MVMHPTFQASLTSSFGCLKLVLLVVSVGSKSAPHKGFVVSAGGASRTIDEIRLPQI